MNIKIVFIFIIILNWFTTYAFLFVVPEDVPTGLVGIYGFAPRIVKGTDSRVGFGFRLGNHADFQVLYEFGPQGRTRPLRTTRRSVPYRQRLVRRGPIIQFLVNAGFLRISSGDVDYEDQPR